MSQREKERERERLSRFQTMISSDENCPPFLLHILESGSSKSRIIDSIVLKGQHNATKERTTHRLASLASLRRRRRRLVSHFAARGDGRGRCWCWCLDGKHSYYRIEESFFVGEAKSSKRMMMKTKSSSVKFISFFYLFFLFSSSKSSKSKVLWSSSSSSSSFLFFGFFVSPPLFSDARTTATAQ